MRDNKKIGRRLEAARVNAGYETAAEAADAMGVKYQTYAAHENGSRGIARSAETYARKFKVSIDWLLEGRGDGPKTATPDRFVHYTPQEKPRETSSVREVVVAAHIQAGHFAESWQWEPDDYYPVFIVDVPEYRGLSLHGAEIRGASMNKRYPEGTVLIFNSLVETQEDLIVGKRYIIERKRLDGDVEHTVKTLHRDAEDKLWLMPESDDPRFQVPISIDEGTGDGDIITIIGRVVFAVSRE